MRRERRSEGSKLTKTEVKHRAKLSQSMRNNDKKTHNQCAESVTGQIKMQKQGQTSKENSINESMRTERRNASQSAPKQRSSAKENSHTMHKQPSSGHSINRNTEKTNRQHVGKSLGAGGADFVGIKVDARDRCIDLQRHAGNAIVSMVTGGG